MMTKKWLLSVVVSLVVIHLAVSAAAAPVVTYTASGSSFNWTLDFSVTNTLGVDGLNIYWFGVSNPDFRTPISGPYPTWVCDYVSNRYFNGTIYGGPDIIYNDMWLEQYGSNTIHNGETLGGFRVVFNTLYVPNSIPFFASAISYAEPYMGTDYYYSNYNPVFFSNATLSAVPVPPAILLLGSGLIGLVGLRKRFKR